MYEDSIFNMKQMSHFGVRFVILCYWCLASSSVRLKSATVSFRESIRDSLLINSRRCDMSLSTCKGYTFIQFTEFKIYPFMPGTLYMVLTCKSGILKVAYLTKF